jgi:hypothetical protein
MQAYAEMLSLRLYPSKGVLGGQEAKPVKSSGSMKYLQSVRIVHEVCLVSSFVLLLDSGSVHLSNRKLPPPHYGPFLPWKDVILGNTVSFGPDINFNKERMLWNKTR